MEEEGGQTTYANCEKRVQEFELNFDAQGVLKSIIKSDEEPPVWPHFDTLFWPHLRVVVWGPFLHSFLSALDWRAAYFNTFFSVVWI